MEFFQGSVDGKLFGPAAQEIGAAFRATSTVGSAAVGTIMGRRSTAPTGNTTIKTMTNNQTFNADGVKLTGTTTTSTKNNENPNTYTDRAAAMESVSVIFDSATQTYTIFTPDASRTFDMAGQTAPFSPLIETLESVNLTVDRTYVRASRWLHPVGPSSPYLFRRDDIVFGMPSTNGQLVRNGKAAYALSFSGTALDAEYVNAMLISGSGNLLIDFPTNGLTLSGALDFGEDYVVTTRPRRKASGSITGTGSLSSSAPSFSGSLNFGGIGNYSGQFNGKFFGPAAQEVGGVFSATDGADTATGNFLGKQDASVPAIFLKLSELTASTTFSAISEKSDLLTHRMFGFNVNKVTYDPASGNYIFTLDGFLANGSGALPITLTNGDIDAAKSDATRTWYTKPLGDGVNVSGYVFKSGSSNTVIGLSYATFADLSVGTLGRDRYYLTYGMATPVALQPRSGTANYSGIVRGYGGMPELSYSGELTGTSKLIADFGTSGFSSTLTIKPDTPAIASTMNFTFGGTILANGFFSNSISPAPAKGEMRGNFFGPNADEFGAVWYISHPLTAGAPLMHGVTVGKKD